jgi:hypothetical protein
MALTNFISFYSLFTYNKDSTSQTCKKSNGTGIFNSSTCLYWSRADNQPALDWESASLTCQNLGGHLISLDNNKLHTAVVHWLSKMSNNESLRAWIGLQKTGWYWTAGKNKKTISTPHCRFRGLFLACIMVSHSRSTLSNCSILYLSNRIFLSLLVPILTLQSTITFSMGVFSAFNQGLYSSAFSLHVMPLSHRRQQSSDNAQLNAADCCCDLHRRENCLAARYSLSFNDSCI